MKSRNLLLLIAFTCAGNAAEPSPGLREEGFVTGAGGGDEATAGAGGPLGWKAGVLRVNAGGLTFMGTLRNGRYAFEHAARLHLELLNFCVAIAGSPSVDSPP
jgi:hypothetical protein